LTVTRASVNQLDTLSWQGYALDTRWISTGYPEGSHYADNHLGFTMSQSVMLFEKLRDDIIAGKFPPGTRLPQQQIAKTYEVSKVLTVAAFARLETSGLVESAIGEGVRVRPINRELLEEEYTFREAIEVQAIREACHHASDREIAELRGLAEQNEAAEEQEAIRLDEEIHLKIAKMSRCQRLVSELKQLHLFERFVSQVTLATREGIWPADHLHLVEPLGNRDPIAAEEQMRCHVQLGRRHGIQAFLEGRSN
jgi:DNA-binding GntR family transcriptional regulator|tara:strand:+ start:386 stop:1144 length:759 start_codon:yes stop_codon:yes gene_type:complete